jgi:CBS-domain-containing membrane protein
MVHDSMSQTVDETMTPFLFAAVASDPVHFAVRRMVETGSHRLVVIDDDGQLVGIVTPMDVIRALHDGRIKPDDFA